MGDRFGVDSAVDANRGHAERRLPIATRAPRHKEPNTTMGVPKRRVSHARQGERRAHLAIELPNLEECSHCHEMKLPHHVCPNCGYYNGRLAIQPKAPAADDAAR